MDVDFSADIHASPAEALAAIADLSTYPSWLSIVGEATPLALEAGDPGPAWSVLLVGRLGLLRKTKRVRMVQVLNDARPGTVRFERLEHDDRAHNSWVLQGSVAAQDPNGTRVTMHLHYGGRMPPGFDWLLALEARTAGPKLDDFLRG